MKINLGKPINSQEKNGLSLEQYDVCNDIFLNFLQSIVLQSMPDNNNDCEKSLLLNQGGLPCDKKADISQPDMLLPAALLLANQCYPVENKENDNIKTHDQLAEKVSNIADIILKSIKNDNQFLELNLEEMEINENKSINNFFQPENLTKLSKNNIDMPLHHVNDNRHDDVSIGNGKNIINDIVNKNNNAMVGIEKADTLGSDSINNNKKIDAKSRFIDVNQHDVVDHASKSGRAIQHDNLLQRTFFVENNNVLKQSDKPSHSIDSSQDLLKQSGQYGDIKLHEQDIFNEKIQIKRYTAKLIVHPKDLGVITANIELRDNKATIEIISNSRSVETALQNQIQFLKSHLEQSSLKIDSINILYSDSFSQTSNEQHSSKSGQPWQIEEKINDPIKMIKKQNSSNNETDKVIDTYI